MKAGLDELTERMPRKAFTAQERGRVSGLPVVMAAVFITSFPSTAVEEQIRLASDRERGGRRGEGALARQRGEMPMRCGGTEWALDKCQEKKDALSQTILVVRGRF